MVNVANMLHGVRPFIIHGEHWLGEPPRKSSCFYPMGKRWLWNLAQSPAHGIIAQALWDGAFPLRLLWRFSSYEKDSLGGVLYLGQ